MDKSNGYEGIANIFIKGRGQAVNGIGSTVVRNWSKTFVPNSTMLDLGCGTGIPVSKILTDEGMKVYGVDASPTMVRTFRQYFPEGHVECEAVESSLFFNRKFDGIIAWGLMFLLREEDQKVVIHKSANALKRGGRLLFTSPARKLEWKDAMTGQAFISLGAERYRELLIESGLSLIEEFEDEGENYYYHALKV